MGNKKKVITGRLTILIFIAAAGIFALCAKAVCHFTSFPVSADCSNLATCIADFYNQGRSFRQDMDIRIHDSAAIGEKTYVLMEIDGQLGSAVLTKSLISGGYKIESIGYGNVDFRESIIENDGKSYLLLGGRDKGTDVASMTFKFGGIPHEIQIPQEKNASDGTFIVCAEIGRPTEDGHLDLNTLALYDSAGNNISDEVGWKSGGGF